MKAYRIRYARKKDRIEVDEDDDLVSEIAPSELSDMIAGEQAADDDYEEEEEEVRLNVFECS